MKRFPFALLSALLAVGLPAAGWSQDAGLFGPEDDALRRLLLRQALELADISEQDFNGQTRLSQRRPNAFDDFDLLREAFRADPDATLDLIELILQAREAQ